MPVLRPIPRLPPVTMAVLCFIISAGSFAICLFLHLPIGSGFRNDQTCELASGTEGQDGGLNFSHEVSLGFMALPSPCDISGGVRGFSPSFPPQRPGQAWERAWSGNPLELPPREKVPPVRLVSRCKATVPVALRCS